MSTQTEYLDEQQDLMDLFIGDASAEPVSIGRPFPLTFCGCIWALMGEKAERVSQTLKYRNGPLVMEVYRILSRKRRMNKSWGETVYISVNIRYGRSGKITTQEELLAAINEIHGEWEETNATAITN